MTTYKNVLIIGGTGMLLEFSKYMIAESDQVLLMNRFKPSTSLINQNKTRFIQFDYTKDSITDSASFRNFSKSIDLVIAWVHSPYDEQLLKLIHFISKEQSTLFKLFHVRGSNGEPFNISQLPETCEYKCVKLGKIQNRWLTNSEISEGVKMAVIKNESIYVGQINNNLNKNS